MIPVYRITSLHGMFDELNDKASSNAPPAGFGMTLWELRILAWQFRGQVTYLSR